MRLECFEQNEDAGVHVALVRALGAEESLSAEGREAAVRARAADLEAVEGLREIDLADVGVRAREGVLVFENAEALAERNGVGGDGLGEREVLGSEVVERRGQGRGAR